MYIIIKNPDYPKIAEIVEDEHGDNLVFDSLDDADSWQWSNATNGDVFINVELD